MDKIKKSVFIKIFCILVLLSLSLAVYLNYKQSSINSCDKCKVNIVYTAPGNHRLVTEVNITDLWQQYITGSCAIRWEVNQNGLE